MNLAGSWKGIYAYDPHAGQPEVAFEMELAAGDGTLFSGSVQDGEGGHPMPGSIAGTTVGGDRMQFVKTMPATLYRFPDGRRVTAQGNQRISYEGTADGPDAFRGTWTVRGGLRFFRWTLFITKTSHGTWRMWRA